MAELAGFPFNAPKTVDITKMEEVVLEKLRSDGARVEVYLVGGIRLIGRIETFDRYVVMLDAPGGAQLIYKHAISTIQPQRDVGVKTRDTLDKSASAGPREQGMPRVTTRRRRHIVV